MSSSDSIPSSSSASRPRRSNKKTIIAVVLVVVILVAGYFAYTFFLHPGSSNNTAVSSVITGGPTVLTGQQYNVTINTTSFSSLNVYFGDLTSQQVANSSAKTYTVQHSYAVPGTAYVYFTEKYTNGKYYNSSNQLLPVTITPSPSLLNDNQSLGIIDANLTASSTPLVANQTIFSPGSHVNISSGYYTEPVHSTYKIVSQAFTVYHYNSVSARHTVNVTWDKTIGEYVPTASSVSFGLSLATAGLYEVVLNTSTAQITNTSSGAYSSSTAVNTSTFLDVAVFSNGALATSTSSIKGQFVIDELVTGGYQSLDPAVAFDTVSDEPVFNTMMPLVGFNGSSTTDFVPMLSTNLPSLQNGEINSKAYSYNVTNPAGKTYKVTVNPYQNYTFYISNASLWQNGQRVTAWDVMYSYARILLFDAGSPLTGGWMIGPDLLPAPYFKTNTYWNITQNMSVNNATNSITFHLQQPMTPISLYGLLSFYRVTSATWLEQNGAGITWTPAGFASYIKYGSENGYNTYVQNHMFSDGPYMLKYTVPGTEIVLTANPNFHSPGPYYPKPSIQQIVIRYVSQASTIYLDMKSGAAQQGTFPTSSWSEVQLLQSSHLVSVISYQSPAIFFWKFNTNVDTSQLASLSPGANMPSNLFTSENVRKAFAYAFNYTYFLDYQVGNSIYKTTFAGPYAGYLETGVVFAQNYSEMQNVSQVPYYSLTVAKNYWNAFMNAEASKVGVTLSGGNAMFNGSAINIPIFVSSSDPVMIEGATTWSQNLAKVIPGGSFPVVQKPFPEIEGLTAFQGKNALPVFEWSLAPAYAYPTDSVGGSEMPTNTSHLGGEDITPYWFNSSSNSLHNATQATQLNDLVQWYAAATATANTTLAAKYFHQINELFVNMTLVVYTQQIYQYHIVSTSINTNVYVPDEENGLLGNDMLFNYLSYA